MIRSNVVIASLLSVILATGASATPTCEKEDVQELCQIAHDKRSDTPELGKSSGWSTEELQAIDKRNVARRDRARALIYEIANPTWRDLWNAGYAISSGRTPQDRLLVLAISIRALSLAPNDPYAHALVAITVDDIGTSYVGAQLYGRQKLYRSTNAVDSACLPQMINPPLPASVGAAFDAPSRPIGPCPKGVGERKLAPPISGAK
jgi:hypothetical protein